MGSLVFQQSNGGVINVVGTNTTSNYTWILPASNDTFVGLTTSQTLTNKTINGAVLNGTIGATTPSSGVFTSVTSPTITSAAATALSIQSAGTTAITVSTSQQVGIGTVSPATALQVVSASGTTAVINATNSTGSGNQYGYGSSLGSTAGNTSSAHFFASTATVGNWYLYGNGTSSFSSDERLKKNIVTTRDGYLQDLCKLRVVKYQWKNGGQQTELGLIAQEVEQVFPGLVQDDLNKIDDTDITYKQLKGSVLPFMLLKAIQELNVEIVALKAKVGI